MAVFSSLSRHQKEAVGLLQIGTFLEYFDLMLYVHMAVLLNELFFPKTDPHTAALLSAFAFCSTYVLRPFGALIFGWIGDNIGRKSTVVITTIMMSISCVVMANLPTYAQIGVSAAWVVTICRIVQGLASMGEYVGANIYLTEIIKPPSQYPAVAFLDTASSFGGVMALFVATIATSSTSAFNWRIAFWIGAGLAVVGSVARTRLRETPEFLNGKRRIKRRIEDANYDNNKKVSGLIRGANSLPSQKAHYKTLISYFLMSCASPLCFYITFMYCGILKKNLGYTAEEIIHQNLFVSILGMISITLTAFLSYKIRPLFILKSKVFILFFFVLLTPHLISHLSLSNIILVQVVFIIFGLAINPAYPIIFQHIPVLKRFTNASFIYATSRALTYIITTFGCVYLTEWFGYYGLLIIMVPITLGFFWGVNHFEKLENQNHHQAHTQDPLSIKPDDLKLAG